MTTRAMFSAALAIAALLAAGCGDDSSGDNAAESTPQGSSEVLPVDENPIRNTSKAPGLRIAQLLVENNVDPKTKGDAPDHLEIHLQNTGKRPLRGLEVYYEITDQTTGDHEAYYRKLGALSIAPGATTAVHFDQASGPNHYPDNPYSLYHTSDNGLDVEVTVSAEGAAVQTASVKKDPGGEEDPNE